MSEVDPGQIMRELGFADPFTASPLARNRGKGVWRMSGESGTVALRVLRPDEHETAVAEQRAMEFARAAGAAVPQVLADGTWRRRPAMVLSWCDGQPLREAVRSRPWTAFSLGLVCGRAQARLHERPAPPTLATEPWMTRFGPLDPELTARLESVEASRSCLIHLDFHADNVLAARGEVSGVVDWTNACVGDGRADLARTWSLLAIRSGRDMRARAAGLLWRLVTLGWHRGYEQVAGPQRDMLLFRVWALTGLLHTSRGEAERASEPFDGAMLQARIAKLRARAGLPALSG